MDDCPNFSGKLLHLVSTRQLLTDYMMREYLEPNQFAQRARMRLDQMATAIRSKNAGPCLLTLDLIFSSKENFDRASGKLETLRSHISDRYATPLEQIRTFVYAPAQAIKITIPRHIMSGDVGDRDVYGAQQHAPLLDIDL